VTQQNAAASEELSATAEELAAQSEELQSSIAFFRIKSGAGEVAKRTVKKAGKAAAGSVADQQARVRGFALDMSHPETSDDKAFREYA